MCSKQYSTVEQGKRRSVTHLLFKVESVSCRGEIPMDND